jgi:hypothetical protein
MDRIFNICQHPVQRSQHLPFLCQCSTLLTLKQCQLQPSDFSMCSTLRLQHVQHALIASSAYPCQRPCATLTRTLYAHFSRPPLESLQRSGFSAVGLLLRPRVRPHISSTLLQCRLLCRQLSAMLHHPTPSRIPRWQLHMSVLAERQRSRPSGSAT